MPNLPQALEYARQHRAEFLNDYKDFLRVPSISTLPEHQPDMQRAAEWVRQQMAAMGLQYAEVVPAAGHPVVYGERLGATGQPTVLIYGHYDVQPVDPLNEWQSPPFEPTIRGDNLYARGASDMKGQVLAFLKALEAWQRAGGLPVNVKVMVEGEEELGSPSLGPFLDQHRAKLACDVSLNIDAGMLRPDLPSLCYGLRGLTYFELWVHGPDHDLHSGIFGGSVHNPAQVLCEVIAQMHDDRGRVTLPGFYDRVRKLSKVERAELARVPHSDREWRRMAGAPQLYGEEGFTTVERVGARPTLEVHGLLSGFTGAGQKTVLPARAMAKISMRLVPHQDETEVEAQLRAFIQKHAPPTVRCEVKLLAANPPVLVQRDSNGVRAAATALEEAFGAQPSFVLGGGSIPVVSLVQAKLGVDSIMTGFGLPDDNLHAPNEKQHLPTWYRGIEALIRFLALLAR